MRRKVNIALVGLSMFAVVLTSCGGPKDTGEFDPLGTHELADPNNAYIPFLGEDRTAVDTYRTAISTIPSSFNYHVASEADVAMHIANFIGGLLTHDEYGRLVKNLATTAEKNTNNTTFTFTIREGVKWMTHDHKQYTPTVNGKKVPQFVTANDFVTTAKEVLTYSNQSNTSFLLTLVLAGAKEYYAFTAVRSTSPQLVSKPVEFARAMEAFIKTQFLLDVTINPDTLDQIKSFERVGIKAVSDYVIEYQTEGPASFFPTMLTYSPFLPTNQHFYNEVRSAQFGKGYDKLLYNGPFILDKPNPRQISYSRNKEYWNPKNVHLNTVVYKLLESDIVPSTIRNMFFGNEIDGFSLTSDDIDGWSEYVVGPNGTGNVQNPYSDIVYSRELNSVDATWHMALNPNRPNAIDGGVAVRSQNASSRLNDEIVSNANKALKLREVREAILQGIDFSLYNQSHGETELEQTQSQINTFTSPNFVFDESGRDYIDFYYQEYADNNNITLEEAKTRLAPGQYEGVNLSTLEAIDLGAKARVAIETFNNSSVVEGTINYPIIIENATLYWDGASRQDDMLWIDKLNGTLNGCTIKQSVNTANPEIPMCSDLTKYPYMEVIMNEKISNADSSTTYVQGGYPNLVVWGWTPDYGDPLSYLNCYRTAGDMSFVVNNQAPYAAYHIENGEVVVTENMYGKYDDLVSQGAAESSNYTNRFSLFAEAEYELVNNLQIIRPLFNRGRGWRASIARTFAYNSPTASYGLAADRLVGLFALKRIPTREERNAVYAVFSKNREEALAATGPIAIYDN